MQDSQPKPSRTGILFRRSRHRCGRRGRRGPARRAGPQQAELPEPKPAPEKGGGYSLSEHVKRYYKTTRV
jgi:hypothetical protein